MKTDFNLFFGWGYGRHHLSRTDAQAARYTAKTRAYSGFISAELIRNMYKLEGFQIGPWLKADYHHVQHNGYSENSGANSQSVSKAKFDSFNTTIGLSIEKELQNILKSDSRLKMFAKAGWNCQPLRSHSTILSTIGGNCIIAPVDSGSKNAAVITAGMRYKINSNFDLTTQWNGIFSKDTTTNSLSIGLGHTF